MRGVFKGFYILFGVFFLGVGIVAIVKPDLAFFWSQRVTYLFRPGCLGVAALILGVLFILGSWVSGWQNFLAFLGLLSFLKGLFFLIAPQKGIDAVLSFWFSHGFNYYRLAGAGMIVLALLIFNAMRIPHKFVR